MPTLWGTLGLPILDLASHSPVGAYTLGAYTLGVYTLGAYSQATDLGSGIADACP